MEYEIKKKSIEIRADDPLLVRVKTSQKKCRCGLPLIKVTGAQLDGGEVVRFICSKCGVAKSPKKDFMEKMMDAIDSNFGKKKRKINV